MAYEVLIRDWGSDVGSSYLDPARHVCSQEAAGACQALVFEGEAKRTRLAVRCAGRLLIAWQAEPRHFQRAEGLELRVPAAEPIADLCPTRPCMHGVVAIGVEASGPRNRHIARVGRVGSAVEQVRAERPCPRIEARIGAACVHLRLA